MYCPTCEGEYRKGIVTCPTCDVALVDSLDDDAHARAVASGPKHGPINFDLVGFTDEHEARDARRALREAKIPCELVIRDAHVPPSAGSGGEPTDEFWIRISSTQAHLASEVLKLDAAVGEDACPSCGAPLEGEGDCPRCGHRLGTE